VVKLMIKRIIALVCRLEKLRKAINDKYDQYCSDDPASSRRQLWFTVDGLIGYGESNGAECKLEGCVKYREMMQKRFGTNSFPCRHTAQHWKDHVTYGPDGDIPPLPRIRENDTVSRVDVLHVTEETWPMKPRTVRKFTDFKAAAVPLVGDHKENRPNKDELRKLKKSPIEDYPFARHIVFGVKYLAGRRGKLADRVVLSYWVLKSWVAAYAEKKKENPTDEALQDWKFEFAIGWWVWAETAEALDEEPSFKSIGPRPPSLAPFFSIACAGAEFSIGCTPAGFCSVFSIACAGGEFTSALRIGCAPACSTDRPEFSGGCTPAKSCSVFYIACAGAEFSIGCTPACSADHTGAAFSIGCTPSCSIDYTRPAPSQYILELLAERLCSMSS
jgi:hypothetical protein